MDNVDLIRTAPTIAVGSGTPCAIAAGYQDYVGHVFSLADAQALRVSNNVAAYDRYYDNLSRFGVERCDELFPMEAAIVREIEEKAADFVRAREDIPAYFVKACVLKMKAIASEVAAGGNAKSLGTKWTEALDRFRTWRATCMDGRNVDMSGLLQERRPDRQPAILFEAVFTAWAKQAAAGTKVGVVRDLVLADLGIVDLTRRRAPQVAASNSGPARVLVFSAPAMS
jgi:hypothetical protein